MRFKADLGLTLNNPVTTYWNTDASEFEVIDGHGRCRKATTIEGAQEMAVYLDQNQPSGE